MRVLLAEDSEVIRLAVTISLEQLGIETKAVENGRHAEDAVRGGQYDLIILDIHMPEMNGFEAIDAIRALEVERNKRTPIIIYSSTDQRKDVQRYLDDGAADAFISKSAPLDELFELVEKLLGM